MIGRHDDRWSMTRCTHYPRKAWSPSSAADTVWLRSQTQHPDQSRTTATDTFPSRFALETSSSSRSSASCVEIRSRKEVMCQEVFGCDTCRVLWRHMDSPVQVKGSDENVLQDLQRRDLRVDCKGSKLHRKRTVAFLENSTCSKQSGSEILDIDPEGDGVCHRTRVNWLIILFTVKYSYKQNNYKRKV